MLVSRTHLALVALEAEHFPAQHLGGRNLTAMVTVSVYLTLVPLDLLARMYAVTFDMVAYIKSSLGFV